MTVTWFHWILMMWNVWRLPVTATYTLATLGGGFLAWMNLFREGGCVHRQATVREGKNYCPDCGQGIIRTWLRMECQGCEMPRPLRYGFWGQVLPQHLCCTHCGERGLKASLIEGPEFHQMRYARIITVSEADYFTLKESLALGGKGIGVTAWVDERESRDSRQLCPLSVPSTSSYADWMALPA